MVASEPAHADGTTGLRWAAAGIAAGRKVGRCGGRAFLFGCDRLLELSISLGHTVGRRRLWVEKQPTQKDGAGCRQPFPGWVLMYREYSVSWSASLCPFAIFEV